jgi:DNA-binding LacI/PurR family transcriptional regulator
VYSLFSDGNPPDALLLLDETFLFHSCAALLELGLLPGRDVKLISQRTFPGVFPAPQPVTFIGFRIEDIVNSCLRALTALSEGGEPTDKFELIRTVRQ